MGTATPLNYSAEGWTWVANANPMQRLTSGFWEPHFLQSPPQTADKA